MAKSLLRKIEERLQRIEAGDLYGDIVRGCVEGKKCKKRNIYPNSFIACASAVPCASSTVHYLTISKNLR
jgi:hypothetical protein